MSKNGIKLQAGVNIGQASAENDNEFLFYCFVDNPVMSHFSNGGADKNFVLGRTGSGKTAILRMIEHNSKSTTSLDVYELSMTYIANSDIFNFLDNIGADLSLFFQYMWRHILLCRFIQKRFDVVSDSNSLNFVERIRERFLKDPKKKRALKYIEDWQDKLWVDTDEIVKEITARTEKELEGEIRSDIAKFRSRGGLNYKISEERKSELRRRVKLIINPEQLQDTSKVLNALKEYDTDSKYGDVYVLIDKIDENWVDESIRFKAIRGLIEAVRVFRGVPHCFIVVALRTDVYERVIQETSDIGFQRDKYEDYFSRILWRKRELKILVDKRINSLYRRKYTKDNVHFEDVFRNNVGQISPFEYMVQRTLLRPRDIIDFVNLCLDRAVGEEFVTAKIIREAEGEYSIKRKDALIAEWKAALPSLTLLFNLLSGRKHRFSVEDISDTINTDQFLVQISSITNAPFDPVCSIVQRAISEKGDGLFADVPKVVVSELYRVGAVGIKNMGSERFYYSYRDAPVMSPSVIDGSTRIHVHEMLHRALSVGVN